MFMCMFIHAFKLYQDIMPLNKVTNIMSSFLVILVSLGVTRNSKFISIKHSVSIATEKVLN